MPTSKDSILRSLPSMDRLLSDPALSDARASLSREAFIRLAREVMGGVREQILAGGAQPQDGDIARAISTRVRSLSSGLRHVINATGVVLHTNLGRAPLSDETIQAMDEASRGFVDLEYDIRSGKRGTRFAHIEPLLCQVTGAEAGMVVNNNAAALLLGLMAMARRREVIVSRGQAVQIGGGVRIPDIMRQSGAKLVEVGTTNVTTIEDYEAAITAKTAGLLRVHTSNFKVVGFTEHAGIEELVGTAHSHSLIIFDDLGSGCLLETRKYGLDPEPMVQHSVALGADLVLFSGDKLLGGPQAGLIVGKKKSVDVLKKHPLARAVRIDRTRLAGVAMTLLHYARGEAESKIPVWKMIASDQGLLRSRAERYAASYPGAKMLAGTSLVGGGSLPGSTLPTSLAAIGQSRAKLDRMAAALRSGANPIICRIESDVLLLDPRTVAPTEDDTVVEALTRISRDQH